MNIDGILSAVSKFFSGLASPGFLENLLSTILISAAIIIVFNIIRFFTGKAMKGHFTQQRIFSVKKVIRYCGYAAAILFIFRQMGIDASALLGAAGIAGIAIGFAAQTSVSNVISGLFLLSEKHFHLGDQIEVDGSRGIVRSIDLLSVKLQTFDNRYIRIPNETIIKTNVTNITRFPIRRMDIFITLPYKEDIEQVKNIFDDVTSQNIYVLDNPAPLFLLDKFDNSGVNIMFGLWFEKTNFVNLKNSFLIELKKRFDAEHIELPYKKIDILTDGESRKQAQAAFPNSEGVD